MRVGLCHFHTLSDSIIIYSNTEYFLHNENILNLCITSARMKQRFEYKDKQYKNANSINYG